MATSPLGQPKEALDTPALLVEMSALERNVERMVSVIVREAGVKWRPHTKAMKTPALAQILLKAGASGVTCAKLGEAEAMAAGGVGDILIANQIVGPQKIARLVDLRNHADVITAVDNFQNAEAISHAARENGVRVRAVIEVNVGMNRAGLEPGEETLTLARKIAALPGLKFAGVMTWESHALGIADADEKRRVVADALRKLTNSARLCEEAGLPVEIVSCGGTGTYWLSAFQPGVTEIQAGGGVFCDLNYRRNFGVQHDYALTILATVTSRPTPTRIVCDAGRKAMSSDAVAPEPIGLAETTSVSLHAEHALIELSKPSPAPRVSDKIEFIVGYSDTTVVLHDELYCIRNGRVEAVWQIMERNRMR